MRRPLAVAANRSRFRSLNQADYFELLDLARGFDIDAGDLDARWKARAAAVHPDRFVGVSDAQKRVAMQWSAQINEAYRVLRDPLRRAQYLCELAGHPVADQPDVGMDLAFLGQQMQWREELEDVRASADLDSLAALKTAIEVDRQTRQTLTANLIAQGQWPDVLKSLREWMFVEKFMQEIKSTERALNTTE
jgi:molecular chaperone HscB